MSDFQPAMNLEKFKKAIRKLPDDPTQGVEFLAFRAESKSDKVVNVGLYVGKDMKSDYSKDKTKFKGATSYKGIIHRSAKNPAKKLVLESTGQSSTLKEIGKHCLLTSKLKMAIVAIAPGELEPALTPEEMLELGITADGSPLPTAPQRPTSAPTQGPVKQPQPTTPKRPFQKAQVQDQAKPQTAPLAGNTRSPEKLALLGRVKSLKSQIEELQKLDGPLAQGFETQLQTVLTTLKGPDNTQTQQTAKTQLQPIETAVWRDLARLQLTSRRATFDQSMRTNFQQVQALTFRAGEGARVDAKLNPNNEDPTFRTLANRLTAVEQNRGNAQALSRFEGLCRAYVQQVQTNPNATEGEKVRAEFARTQIIHARLAQQALNYQALGVPANWDAATEAKASELQAAYFFEEGALHVKQGEFGAAPLGSDGGANQSWWIRRVDPGEKDGKGTRKFIFKPADVEDESVFGYKQGSLAPREVMAKVLSDSLLSSAGFNLGVCPTSLAEVDSCHLPDSQGKIGNGPPRLGSMQQLVESKGTISNVLYDQRDEATLKKVQKDNVDELLVFDLITNAADRHAGNLMVGTGPDGSTRFIPIDHGLTMPNKKTLYANRRRILQNHVLIQPGTDLNGFRNQPLGTKVKEGLSRINPSQVVAQIKNARDLQRQAHPNMDDDLGDENLQVMQRSMEFLQKAAQRNFSAADLVFINSKYCVEIHESKLQDLDTLLDRIEQELPLNKQGVAELETLYPRSMDTTGTEQRYGEAVRRLGWCVEMSDGDAHIWAVENAALAMRIIKNKIVNPAIQKALEERIQQIGGLEKLLDMGISINDSPYGLLSTLDRNLDNLDPVGKLNEQDLQTKYDQLGGETAWGNIRAGFPVGPSLAERSAVSPIKHAGQRRAILRSQIQTLQDWAAFQAEGGLDEFAKLAGNFQMYSKPTVRDALRQLREAKAMKTESNELQHVTPVALAQRQLKMCMSTIAKLGDPALAAKYMNLVRNITRRLIGRLPDTDKLRDEAIELHQNAELQLRFETTWPKRLDILRKAVSVLEVQRHPKSKEMRAELDKVAPAIDNLKPGEALKACAILDKLVMDATGAKKK